MSLTGRTSVRQAVLKSGMPAGRQNYSHTSRQSLESDRPNFSQAGSASVCLSGITSVRQAAIQSGKRKATVFSQAWRSQYW